MRDLSDVSYIPLLSVRPAEIRALKELPEKSKDKLFPFMFLRPWTTAHQLDNALVRISEAYGNRPFILDAGTDEVIDGAVRPVHLQLAALRNSADGYRNWYEFLIERTNFIPSLQLGDITQLEAQIELLASLGRGVAVRFPQQTFVAAKRIVQLLSQTFAAEEVCVIVDYEQASRELLTRIIVASNIAEGIWEALPGCAVAFSASSFPSDFVGRTDQEIYERNFFNSVKQLNPTQLLIYSDRGSAKVERQSGGGGTPAPRVDLASSVKWDFFREDNVDDRNEAYFRAARRSLNSPLWEPKLNVWGTQMISRTAINDDDAIVSPARSTAVRINLHLHQQLFYGASLLEKYDTDEDWSDI